MTANVEALLPGASVLLDVDGNRGSRGIVIRQVHAPLGNGVTIEVCPGPCARLVHSTDCAGVVSLHSDELLLIPEPGVAPPEAAPSNAPGSHLVPDGAAPHDGFGVGLVSS